MKKTMRNTCILAAVIALCHFLGYVAMSARQSSNLSKAMQTGDQELFRKVHFGENRFRVLTFPATQLSDRPGLITYAGASVLWGLSVSLLIVGVFHLAKANHQTVEQHGGQISSEGAPSAPPNEPSP